MKNVPYFLILLFVSLISPLIIGQVTYQSGQGSVPSGVVVNTDNFSRVIGIPEPKARAIENEPQINGEPQIDPTLNSPPFGSNYYEDKSVTNPLSVQDTSLLLSSFAGISMTNSIPPDPIVAVGPNHIIAMVNTRFKIFDKAGNVLKDISAGSFFSSLGVTALSPFDPQIMYDHYSGRWIMVWDQEDDASQTAYFLLAVSDDDNPLGTWYEWALPANLNGSVNSNTWSDYPGIGYDDNALYIDGRQFPFGGGYLQYNRIRIIPKSDLYQGAAGQVNWTDLWNITYPNNSQKPDVIRPAITYGSTNNTFYLLHSPYGGNFVTLFTITDPLGSATLTGVNVPVTYFVNAPNANQLGGGSLPIEVGGSTIKHAPTFRDGYLYASHAIANPNQLNHIALGYLKIDVNTSTAVEDYAFGATDYYLYYPNLAVDTSDNVCLTYSMSGDSIYAGAYYTTRLSSDPPGFEPSSTLKAGVGNYVVDYGSGRNRWGDYMGAFTDPSDENNIWIFTEYVSATNVWNTWTGEVRMVPYLGPHIFTKDSVMAFGDVELNTNDTLTAMVHNFGNADLTINNIPNSSGDFHLITSLSYPFTLSYLDSISLTFVYTPTTLGEVSVNYPVNSNDPVFPGFTMDGNGYHIIPAVGNEIYVSTGTGNDGDIATIDKGTGAATIIGPSLFTDIKSISINPVTNNIYGIYTTLNSSELIRVNADSGDSYLVYQIDLSDLAGIAFDTTGNLYMAKKSGELYTFDLNNATYNQIATVPTQLSGITFNPISNELWGSVYALFGSNKDRIVKINLSTGDTTAVGNTGFGEPSNDIVFDKEGNLFGVKGSSAQDNDFFSINTNNGQGTIIGSTGIKHIRGLALTPSSITYVGNNTKEKIPDNYSLAQNYPNPFNPSTTIGYTLPVQSKVKLIVYNILGEVVAALINGQQAAGTHNIVWNAASLSSGVYFYELRTEGNNGVKYSQIKKMVLLK
jgi:Secretion system C-terminal sorting domain